MNIKNITPSFNDLQNVMQDIKEALHEAVWWSSHYKNDRKKPLTNKPQPSDQ